MNSILLIESLNLLKYPEMDQQHYTHSPLLNKFSYERF